jgi:uncharacterized membrane protein YozB (DUF420 family)
MMVLCVVFVVLMMFWLFGGGYVSYEGKTFDAVRFGGGTLIPWLCVAILGWVIFNGAR